MSKTIEFQLDSPWCLVLLAMLPLFLVGMYALEKKHSKAKPKDDPAGETGRAGTRLWILAALSTLTVLSGASATLWVLVATREDPFKHPMFIGGLGLLVIAVWINAWTIWTKLRFRPVMLYPSTQIFSQALEHGPTKLRFVPIILRMTAFVLIVFALTRPQSSTTKVEKFAEGMDIIFALDVSTSMRAVDFASQSRHARTKSRIGGAKEVIANFIQQRNQDRLGLVVFANEAYTQCPLTLDYSVLQAILKSVKTGVIRDGTAIGNAMLVSVNRLKESETKSKVIILLTDGYENASEVAPEQAAQIAAQQNIQVFPILVGKGGLVPYPIGLDESGHMKYRQTKIPTDPDLLKRIASISKSKFYRATDQDALEKDLQDILDHMEKSRLMDPGKYTRKAEIFHWALLPAFLALSLQLILSWTRFRKFP